MNFKTILYTLLILVIFLALRCAKEIPDPDTEMDPEISDPDTTMIHVDTSLALITKYNLTLNLLGTLPNEVNESSGLSVYSPSTYWTHNDHGDDAILYLIDDTGSKIREFEINNSENEDWEDLTSDSFGNIYISDTGNNSNDRQDLRIYVVFSSILNNNNGQASVINVSYEDQFEYPPSNNELKYDVEASIFLNGYIYMFTRDRTIPFIGNTRLYRIVASPGNQIAKLITQYSTTDNVASGSITGAAVSPSGDKIAIVSNTKMWVFKNFVGEDFFGQDIDIFTFDTDTQVEAIDFINECTIVLSDEKNDSSGGNLYNANICY